MPWAESSVGKLRKEFVLEALHEDANVSEVCRKYGISRKTGYKWLERYRAGGPSALEDGSRRPHRFARNVSGEVVLELLKLRERHPRWGPKKLRQKLEETLRPEGVEVPSVRTLARIIERAGLADPKKRRRTPVSNAPTTAPKALAEAPNDLWTVDFKGWWRTKDGHRCEPLTVRDAASRYVLAVELVESTSTTHVRPAFERLFERYGLPKAIQVDNGSPFANVRSRGGMTQLSAWWVSLGIRVVRGRPAHPQDNGGHERMHADLRDAVELHPEENIERQRRACEEWRQEFNEVRPHEALGQATPSSVYVKSARRFGEVRRPRYIATAEVRKVTCRGTVTFQQRKVAISQALAGYHIGLEPVAGARHRVWFYDLDLGEVDISKAPPDKGAAREAQMGT